MVLKIDVGKALIPKKGEELPGDTVEIDKSQSSTVVVLADGLGSGVKLTFFLRLQQR